jgi:hypothetical protein
MKKNRKFLLLGRGNNLRLRLHNLVKVDPLHKRSRKTRLQRPRRRRRLKNLKLNKPQQRIKGVKEERRKSTKRKRLQVL